MFTTSLLAMVSSGKWSCGSGRNSGEEFLSFFHSEKKYLINLLHFVIGIKTVVPLIRSIFLLVKAVSDLSNFLPMVF